MISECVNERRNLDEDENMKELEGMMELSVSGSDWMWTLNRSVCAAAAEVTVEPSVQVWRQLASFCLDSSSVLNHVSFPVCLNQCYICFYWSSNIPYVNYLDSSDRWKQKSGSYLSAAVLFLFLLLSNHMICVEKLYPGGICMTWTSGLTVRSVHCNVWIVTHLI